MFKRKQLPLAIRISLTSSALALCITSSAFGSSTMYNLYNASESPRVSDGPTDGSVGTQLLGSDGWVWGGIGVGYTGDTSDPGWVGPVAATTDTPFGYTGSMSINWAADISAANHSLEISQEDGWRRYGVYADIDTDSGAWHQAGQLAGRRHNIDIGLFKSDVTQKVTFNISGVLHPETNFGITIYQGYSTSLEQYHHHGTYFGDNSASFEGLTHLIHTQRDPITGVTNNSLEFVVTAGQIYTIWLGGNNGQWYRGFDSYRLNIATSPVPIPSAVWLFGSAVIGLLGFSRKQW